MTSKKKLFLSAMSGGVDSSVATALFLEQGFDVLGVTLVLQEDKQNSKAAVVAKQLGIEHRFLHLPEAFEKRVMRPSWEEYKSGRTPNPCALCNHNIKFGPEMIKLLEETGAEGIITGHYAVVDRSSGKAKLFKGANIKKDQTYFLSTLTQEQLNLCYMPLGNTDKEDVRRRAGELGLISASQKDSQDACFSVPGEPLADTLADFFDEKAPTGDIYDDKGNFLGRHDGICGFTIGQRKGHSIALGERAYVIKIDGKTSKVIVSTDKNKLLSTSFYADDMSWLDFDCEELQCEVQTRYRQPLKKAVVIKQGDRALVRLAEPLASITPGQRLAIFKNNQLLGGGWISSEFPEQ